MKALTLWRPWPWSILYGTKRIENRRWVPPPSIFARMIALHAGLTWDYDGALAIRELCPDLPGSSDDHPLGIVGVARVIGVVDSDHHPNLPFGQSDWFSGPFAWVLSDVVALPRAIPCKGMQGLWSLPKDVETEVQDFLGAHAKHR